MPAAKAKGLPADKHQPTVQASMHGCRVVCSCGQYTSHAKLEQSYSTKKQVLKMWHEDHFLPAMRKTQRRASASNNGNP